MVVLISYSKSEEVQLISIVVGFIIFEEETMDWISFTINIFYDKIKSF